MIIEKILFLILVFVGLTHNQAALVPSGMLFVYICVSEFLTSKKDKEALRKYIDDEISKLGKSIDETDNDIQKLNNSIVSLKMDKGIKSISRG